MSDRSNLLTTTNIQLESTNTSTNDNITRLTAQNDGLYKVNAKLHSEIRGHVHLITRLREDHRSVVKSLNLELDITKSKLDVEKKETSRPSVLASSKFVEPPRLGVYVSMLRA